MTAAFSRNQPLPLDAGAELSTAVADCSDPGSSWSLALFFTVLLGAFTGVPWAAGCCLIGVKVNELRTLEAASDGGRGGGILWHTAT